MNDPSALAASFAVAVVDGDQDTITRILASLDRRGLHALATALAANVDLDQTWRMQPRRRAPIKDIVEAVATHYGMSPNRILSADRTAGQARLVLYYVARLAGWSTPSIAAHVGRDHSTVAVGSRRASERTALVAAANEIIRHLTTMSGYAWDHRLMDKGAADTSRVWGAA